MGVKLIYNKNRIANINLWLEITKPKTAQIPIYELDEFTVDRQQPEAVKKTTGCMTNVFITTVQKTRQNDCKTVTKDLKLYLKPRDNREGRGKQSWQKQWGQT